MMANFFRRIFGGLIEDPAEKLIIAAVRDENLMRALYTPLTSAKIASTVQAKLNGWAASVLREAGETGPQEKANTPPR